MKKIKGIVAMLIAMVVLLTTGGTRAYADDSYEPSKEFLEAIDKYRSETTGKSEYDADAFYNANRTYFTQWYDEILLEAISNNVQGMLTENGITDSVEAGIEYLKDYYRWDDNADGSGNIADNWLPVYIQLYNVTTGTDVDVTFNFVYSNDEFKETVKELYRSDTSDIHFKTTVKKEDGYKKAIFLPYDGITHNYGFYGFSDGLQMTKVVIRGDNWNLEEPVIHCTVDLNIAPATIQIVFNETDEKGYLLEEDISGMSKEEITEFAKEEGFIKEVAPAEKKETVNLDEMIKAVTSDKQDNGSSEAKSDKNFPVLPVVVGVVAVCLIGAVIFVVVKRKKQGVQ